MPVVDGTGGFARHLWGMLNDGGTWTVPRCGINYTKDEAAKQLVLTARMPWVEGMPVTAEELRAIQDEEHATLVNVFAAIGVEAIDATSGESEGAG